MLPFLKVTQFFEFRGDNNPDFWTQEGNAFRTMKNTSD